MKHLPERTAENQCPLPDRLAAALWMLLERLADRQVLWVLTGSAAFALRGIPCAPRDLDLQSDTAGVYQLESILREFQHQAVNFVTSGRVRSHWGRLAVNGVQVDLIGDIEKRLTDGTWTAPPDLAVEREWLCYEGYQVPVLRLAYEIQAYRQMGRRSRAQQLNDWLSGMPAGAAKTKAEGIR